MVLFAARFMKTSKSILVAAGFLAVIFSAASAQPSVVTVTNVVTVTVTNVVTVTNFAAAVPAPVVVPVPAASAKPAWHSSVSAGLTLIRGNKNSTMLTADFVTQKKTPANEYTLGAGTAHGEQNSQETVNNYRAFAQWNHLFSERFFSYLRTDGLHDSVADLDYRFNLGPGVGYYFLKGTNTSLSVESGAGFEVQRLGGNDESFATVRLAEEFEHKFNDRARLWQRVELLPQVDKFDNYLVNFEIGIETAFTRSFSLKTYLVDTYANRPALNRKKNDSKIVAAVSYKF